MGPDLDVVIFEDGFNGLGEGVDLSLLTIHGQDKGLVKTNECGRATDQCGQCRAIKGQLKRGPLHTSPDLVPPGHGESDPRRRGDANLPQAARGLPDPGQQPQDASRASESGANTCSGVTEPQMAQLD